MSLIFNFVIVKRSSKIFEKSFLKNAILEFWWEALIVSIVTNSSNDNYVNEVLRKIMKIAQMIKMRFNNNFYLILKKLFIPLMAYVSNDLISDCLVKLDEKFGTGCRTGESDSSSFSARHESPTQNLTTHASSDNVKKQTPNANNSTNHPIADTNEQVKNDERLLYKINFWEHIRFSKKK